MTGQTAAERHNATLDSSEQRRREERFLRDIQAYRSRLRDLAVVEVPAPSEIYTLEREFDRLLMECGNLAREPLVRHMALAMQHAVNLAPSPFVTYPDSKKGAES